MLHRASGSVPLVSALALTSCLARDVTPTPDRCPDVSTLTCVRPAVDDPCGPPTVVAPVCDPTTHTLTCPEGARVHAAVTPAAVCVPFGSDTGPVRDVAGSLVRVPTEDGRCAWIAEDVTLADGSHVRNVAFDPPLDLPFGTCPTSTATLDGTLTSAVALAGGDDPRLQVQISAAYRLNGHTRVLYRLFRVDGSAAFGVTDLGSGLAAWDTSRTHIVIPATRPPPFGTDTDMGHAALTVGADAFVWGCPGPTTFLAQRCIVARVDASDAVSLLAPGAQWSATETAADSPMVFTAGPWISSVVPLASEGSLLHVYAIGFASTLDTHQAAVPEGPWTDGPRLATCDLPSDDMHAFCAGPVVHEELIDPTQPRLLPVSYGVGTTVPPGSTHARAYDTRLQWLAVP